MHGPQVCQLLQLLPSRGALQQRYHLAGGVCKCWGGGGSGDTGSSGDGAWTFQLGWAIAEGLSASVS